MNKRVSGLIILMVASLCWHSPAFGDSEKIKWQTYERGMTIGKGEAKKVFVYFWAAWCGYCRKMDATTFNDPKVISFLNQNFIPVRVDLDKDRKVAVGYNVKGVPQSWFISETGERIASNPGYSTPEQLLHALKFISTDSYKQMSFQDFLRAQ